MSADGNVVKRNISTQDAMGMLEVGAMLKSVEVYVGTGRIWNTSYVYWKKILEDWTWIDGGIRTRDLRILCLTFFQLNYVIT